MHEAAKQQRILRLVKSTSTIRNEQKPMNNSDEYYQQVQRYAEQIRKTTSADEIIRILDIVLSDTRGLRLNEEVFAAQEQVRNAEEKIESLKSELELLRSLVQTDQMTGAFNRRGLEDIFKREAARADRNAQPLGVVLVDIDNFKQINDNLGHQYGDAVLTNFVAVAKETLRPSDIVARFGGEEFVILLPDVEMENALTIIQRVQNNLARSYSGYVNEHQVITVTFSAGVAIRSFGEHQNSVINRADKALYQAKRTGKNRAIPALI